MSGVRASLSLFTTSADILASRVQRPNVNSVPCLEEGAGVTLRFPAESILFTLWHNLAGTLCGSFTLLRHKGPFALINFFPLHIPYAANYFIFRAYTTSSKLIDFYTRLNSFAKILLNSYFVMYGKACVAHSLVRYSAPFNKRELGLQLHLNRFGSFFVNFRSVRRHVRAIRSKASYVGS